MPKLINTGTVPEVKKAVRSCKSRNELWLALHHESNKKQPRKTVIALLEEKLKS